MSCPTRELLAAAPPPRAGVLRLVVLGVVAIAGGSLSGSSWALAADWWQPSVWTSGGVATAAPVTPAGELANLPGEIEPVGYPPAAGAPPLELGDPGLLPDPGPPPAGSVAEPLPAPVVVVEAAPVVLAPPPKLWDGSFELGLNGASGNSDMFNMRTAARFKRKVDWAISTIDLIYTNNESNGVQTANRLFGEGRHEWLMSDSPWTVYVHGTTEYDQFRAFDVRLTADAGFGYHFWKTDDSRLLVRSGLGASHEIGGPDDAIVPEGVFGLEFDHRLSARQKLTAKVDYFPALEDPSDFRINAQAWWEILLDEAWNLSLKLGVTDRYDSTPHGARPNDFEYSALLMWSF